MRKKSLQAIYHINFNIYVANFRGTQSTQGAIYLSFMENLKTFISFDTISEESLKEKILPLIRNPERIVEKILGGGIRITVFQKKKKRF